MNKPIRILHVFNNMGLGGAETLIMNIYRNIDHNKIQFDFIVHTNEKSAYDDEIEDMGGKIYRIPKFNGVNFLQYINSWKNFFRNYKKYNVIHGHLGSTAAIYLKLANNFDLYTIAHSHGVINKNSIKDKIYSFISYPTRFIADFYFACSKIAGKSRYGESIINSKNFKVFKNGIQTKKFTFNKNKRIEMRKTLSLKNKFVVGHVGRFDFLKNQKFLIEIFKEILKSNVNSVLLLVGDGKLKNNVEKKVLRFGIEDKVIFTGERNDVPELLQAMDAFTMPSKYEGFGIAALEAQAAGLPTIVSDALPEEVVITNLITKISLKKSAKYWANKILKYSNSNFHRSINHQTIIDKGYDIKENAKWLEKYYLKINNKMRKF